MPLDEKVSIRTTSIQPMQLRATIVPESFNEENRTVQITFSTGARVKREFIFSEGFHEELSLKRGHVRLERLNNGAPFLNAHGGAFRTTLTDVLGVLSKATVDGKVGKATVRFSKREDVEPIFQDVRDGILQHVSVGYRVHKFKEVGEAEDGLKIMRAIDWEPFEVSAVPAGADDAAKFRSDKTEKNDCEIEVIESERIEAGKDEDQPPADDPKPGVENNRNLGNDKPTGENDMTEEEKRKLAEDAKAEGIKAERERQVGIREACKKANMDEDFTRGLVEDGEMTVDAARTAIIDKLAANDKKKPTHSGEGARIDQDETKTFREGVAEALLHRFRSKKTIVNASGQQIEMPGWELTDKGRDYRYLTLLDIARKCLERHGVNTAQMSKMQIAGMALSRGGIGGLHSTDDYPLILEDIVNKTMRQGYLRSPITWSPFVREVTAPDFKTISRVNMGDGGKLKKVLEHGEFPRNTKSESAEKYNVETFGRIFGITRQALVNDDMNAFSTVPERHGRRARDLESDEIWGLMFANADLSDGVALFASGHSNLSGSAGVPTETRLNELRQSMRLQVGLDGEVIAIVPRWIYVSPKDETVSEKLVATITPDSSGNVSPFSQSGRTPLQLAVEPRIEQLAGAGAKPWFGSAQLDQVDMIELARLEGNEGPTIESRMGFEVDGMEIKVRHDIGTKAIDFRGLFKNAGAV